LKSVIDQYEQMRKPPKTWFTGSGRKRVERVFGDLMPKPKEIKPGGGVPERHRVLTPEELKRVLPVLHTRRTAHARAMAFMLLTLARREEAAGAAWSEIDLEQGTWTIPPERQKNTKPKDEGENERKPFVIPLSRQAVALLRSVKPWERQPNGTAMVFASRNGKPPTNWDREQKAIFEATGTQGWHRQDLRRTGATMMGECGSDAHVVEAALNHETLHSPLAGRYNKSRYRDDVKGALQALANQYDLICCEFKEQPDEYGEPEMARVSTPIWAEASPLL
jgi:integrase